MDSKVCSKCEADRPASDFWRRGTGLSPWCKPCHRTRASERYKSPIEKRRIRENNKRKMHTVRLYIWGILTRSNCADCGESDPVVLEFDHLDGSAKERDISSLRDCSIAKLQSEIDKCEVVCANCHKKRTSQRGDHWRVRFQRGEIEA